MNTVAELPLPKDAPAAGSCVRIERPEPGLAVVVLDPPHRTLAVFDLALMRDLAAALEVIAKDRTLKGVVFTGRTPTSFAAGADIEAIAGIENKHQATDLATFGQDMFQKIADLEPFTVAAVGGPVPGGAFELSLACDRILLADHPSTRIGLPETRLGILPGWGGCQRLPRRVGVPKALAAILSGKLYRARQARKLGLVDRLTFPEYLIRIATEVAMGRMPCKPVERGIWRTLIDKNPLALGIIGRKVAAGIAKQTGGHYPAPKIALKLVLNAPRTPMKVGLEREAEALGSLAVSPVCKSLVGIFQLSENAKRLAKTPSGDAGAVIDRAAVIGGGVMGAAIAGLMAERGLSVRLADLAREPLDAALVEHAKRVTKATKKRVFKRHEATAAIDRLTVTTAFDGLAHRGLVIEAVAEKLEIKRKVLLSAAEQAGPDTILATNTSSLSVSAIAEGLPHPERVVGMHFFNPVHLMPLVEVIRGAETSNETVAATAKLALRMGKTPVVVADVAGFLVNRLLGPYLDEAVRMLQQGVDATQMERAVRAFGMPMGPLELLDEVGLDIAAHAASSLEEAYGERMAPSDLVQRMLDAGLTGKKSGAGFYLYETDPKTGRSKRGNLNPKWDGMIHENRGLGVGGEQNIVDQLVLAMVNEAALCLEEQVVTGPRELDLATVFGMGFPPFRGGLLKYADRRGLPDVLGALRRVHEAPDLKARPNRERFHPVQSIRDLAERDGRFHA